MKKVAFYTLGCKVNQYETDAMAGLFSNKDYTIVDFEDEADVYVINTCTVTGESSRKSRQIIRRAVRKNLDAVIAVVGCYSQIAAKEVAQIPGVDLIIGTHNRHRIVELVEQAKDAKGIPVVTVGDIMSQRDFEEISPFLYKDRTRAFLKIQEGCNQFCAYCIIPYTRGPVRSRLPQDVLHEARHFAGQGFKEIVLTGIHTGAYGIDLKEISLADLIEKICARSGVKRVRLSSIEPTEITNEFISRTSNLSNFCRHFHIPLQSGSSRVLKLMNRKYTSYDYLNVIENIRKAVPGVGITTDIMVGFPGENEKDLDETCETARKAGFSKIHVFKYSKRPGTPAAKFKDQVSEGEKEDRSHRLIKLGSELERCFNSKFIGSSAEVLLEQEIKNEPGVFEGLTDNYIRVFIPTESQNKGEIIRVKLTEAFDDHVRGQQIT
jgi:threonylcarbamoyladenosine tRNA methylthiotransferase MtaB